MRKGTNDQVLNAFVYNSMDVYANQSESIYVVNAHTPAERKLMNYGTCIAQYIDGELYVNRSKYSVTTSKVQNQLVRKLYQWHEIGGKEQVHIPMGTRDLSNLIVNSREIIK